MTNESQSYGVLTEQDLVSAWVHMLKERNAAYCEVNLDELNYQLMLETRTHYSVKNVKHPLKRMLMHFDHTKWQWLRLEKKVKERRKMTKMLSKQCF